MQNFIAVLAANCDPDVESCSAIASQEQLERPPIDDFRYVTVAYIMHPLYASLTFNIVAWFYDDPNDRGAEADSYLVMPWFALLVN